MCNDFGNRIPYSAYVEAFREIRIPIVFPRPEEAPNLEPRDEIWPSELAPVIRAAEGGAQLSQTPWGLSPNRPKAPLVINMRSEGRSFARGRCLVPASHYYEFTGAKSPKTRWRFTRTDREWFCFAGLLGRCETKEGSIEAFALLTTAPGPDVVPYHNRQPVVLDAGQWAAWLDLSRPAQDLLKPSPAGSLQVEEAPRSLSLFPGP